MAFNARSTAEQVTEGLDLSGKTYLVTGVNSGLGMETMRVLTMRGGHVIGAARTMSKARDACESIDGKTTPVACELSEMDSVAACAYKVRTLGIPIDALICNAGIMALPELTVKRGLEMQFLTNHMGHFLLTYLLQDELIKAEEGRIVILSSSAHWAARGKGIDFTNLDGSKGYDPFDFYCKSKLANLLTARAFNNHLNESGVTANAVHPGVINTGLSRDVGGLLGAVFNNKMFAKVSSVFMKSIPQGASTQCYVATHPEVKGVGGLYFADNKPAKMSAQAGNDDLGLKLWDYSLRYLHEYVE